MDTTKTTKTVTIPLNVSEITKVTPRSIRLHPANIGRIKVPDFKLLSLLISAGPNLNVANGLCRVHAAAKTRAPAINLINSRVSAIVAHLSKLEVVRADGMAGTLSNPEVNACYRLNLDLPIGKLGPRTTLAALITFYEEWSEESGKPMPLSLSRHVASHRVAAEHLNAHNCLMAIMLMASLIKSVSHLEEQQLVVEAE